MDRSHAIGCPGFRGTVSGCSCVAPSTRKRPVQDVPDLEVVSVYRLLPNGMKLLLGGPRELRQGQQFEITVRGTY